MNDSNTFSPSFNPSLSRSRRARGAFLLNLPIAQRLALGFLIAALIAAAAASISGIQRVQSLDREAAFYHNLLQTNTDLNTAASYLQLMNTKVQDLLDVASRTAPSQETIQTDEHALGNLAHLYTDILTKYTQQDLLALHPDQISLLNEAGAGSLPDQQRTLTGSVLRTWLVYRNTQDQVVQDVSANNIQDAQALERVQGQSTNSDALSALRTLIQLDTNLASSVSSATLAEGQTQTMTTIIAALLAFLAIALVGWLISRTLILPLQRLRAVTQAVEAGQLSARVDVRGHDEVAQVSESVNTMLDTIVGLLKETRDQRDALTNAALHLYSYIQVASAGELRASAIASDDPISLLADAFNFTIGRVRRFVLRTQTGIEQLEVISRQELAHSNRFAQLVSPHLSRSAHEPGLGTQPTPVSPFSSRPPQSGEQSEARGQELPRIALGFAREVTALARQLQAITQEMRVNVSSFKFEKIEVSSFSVPMQPNMIPHTSPNLLGGKEPGKSSA